MFRSEKHYHRSRACAVAAIEQHAVGAEGLALILAATSAEEGRRARLYQNHERELLRMVESGEGFDGNPLYDWTKRRDPVLRGESHE